MTQVNCDEPDCENPRAKGLKICHTHYRRKLRGSKREGPPREYGQDQVIIPAPGLPAKVAFRLRAAATVNEASLYQVLRQIVRAWLVKYEARPRQFPYLCPDALTAENVPDKAHVSTTTFALLPDEAETLARAAEEATLSRNGLVIHILEDWFRFWTGKKHAEGAAFTISPYGPSPKVALDARQIPEKLVVKKTARHRVK